MELKSIGRNLTEYMKKYRFVILVLVIGVAFMLMPTGRKQENAVVVDVATEIEKMDLLEQNLAETLTKIQGAGKVDVLLTECEGEETVYQTDYDQSQSESSSSQRNTTVMITDEQRAQGGLIRQVNPPKYKGALIVCQGADSPTVRLAITDAVSKVTGLGTDCIAVLKMK